MSSGNYAPSSSPVSGGNNGTLALGSGVVRRAGREPLELAGAWSFLCALAVRITVLIVQSEMFSGWSVTQVWVGPSFASRQRSHRCGWAPQEYGGRCCHPPPLFLLSSFCEGPVSFRGLPPTEPCSSGPLTHTPAPVRLSQLGDGVSPGAGSVRLEN